MSLNPNRNLPEVELDAIDKKPPPIAWPTIILSMTATMGSCIILYDQCRALTAFENWKTVDFTLVLMNFSWRPHVSAYFSAWQASLFLTIFAFIHFTPMHDASHGAIATKASGCKWINNSIGRVSATFLFSPFLAFRHMHLHHHRYVNNPSMDPDNWCCQGPWWQLPLRWMTIIPLYYAHYLPPLIRNQRPQRECIESICTLVLMIGSIWISIKLHLIQMMIMYWIGPAVIALSLLAFSFDYLPHRPGIHRDKYRATAVLRIKYDALNVSTCVLLYQNYHNVHHLWPWIPFYRYSALYWKHATQLAKRGTITRDLIPLFVTNHND